MLTLHALNCLRNQQATPFPNTLVPKKKAEKRNIIILRYSTFDRKQYKSIMAYKKLPFLNKIT